MTKREISEWIEAHDAQNWSVDEIAKGIVLDTINNTSFAEDTYPGLKDQLIHMVINWHD